MSVAIVSMQGSETAMISQPREHSHSLFVLRSPFSVSIFSVEARNQIRLLISFQATILINILEGQK